MRAIGFYISDFAADSAGFVVSDLDDLISRGVITCRASSAATHRAGGGWSGCSSGLRT
jgi:hypothetical protein